MPERKDRQKPHEFAKIPEFDEAMRKLAKTPKEAVEKREGEGPERRTTRPDGDKPSSREHTA